MPRRVDPDERRGHIAAALLRIAAQEGLAAVSLRTVAREAGVTSGAVQHYFPSKHSMLEYAMHAASGRYESRIGKRMAALGERPHPRDAIWVLLSALLPSAEPEAEDARVGLAFQAHAATHDDAAEHLAEGNARLRAHLAGLIRASNPAHPEPAVAATLLLASAEGLAVQMLSSGLQLDDAQTALELQLVVVVDAS